ncbi:MAG: hypothetical protein HZC02_03730 [Candidatus Levybacteria bacterium]|nr:hypothetical protein [Candidatus Levybacteria bacterium]
MDNQALQKIKDIIAGSQSTAIIVGANPSIDQMAAALSFYLSLQAQGKAVSVISPTQPIVEVSSLVGIDKVATSNESAGGDLVVSFPYREGEIEKVSYTIDNNLLNIVVKAGELGLNFSEQDVVFKRGSSKPTLVIAIGITSLHDVESNFPQGSLGDVPIINIDNKRENEGYGSMILVSAKFSSLSEQVADLMLNLSYDFDVDVAQNLLSGITNATNNFQSQTTSYLAFEIASILLKKGAQRMQNSLQAQAAVPQSRPSFVQAQSQQVQPLPAQPQPQQRQKEERQDRREAIREALRAQSQTRQHDQRTQSQRPERGFQQAQGPISPQQVQQPQLQPKQQNDQKPPSDWLTPKVYKGSSSV